MERVYMKNNKGFTLTELLVVIVILGIVMAIAYPAVSDVLFASRKSTNEITIKNIEDAAEMFIKEIYICDSTSNILNILRDDLGLVDVTNCSSAKEKLREEVTLPLEVLKNREYITKAEKCDGNIILSLNGDTISDLNVNIDNITCN